MLRVFTMILPLGIGRISRENVMNNNDKKKSVQEDGLPEVAQSIRENRKIIFTVLGIIITLSFLLYAHSRSKVEPNKEIEETYTIGAGETSSAIPVIAKPITATPTKGVTQPPVQLTPDQLSFIQEKQKELQQRLASPLMVVNNNQGQTSVDVSGSTPAASPNDLDSQFLNKISSENVQTSNATQLGSLNTVIAQGSLIHANLETEINSDLPGSVRAIVSDAVFSEDGTQELVPKGSRLLGQYKSGMLQGQSRVFVVWTRLLTPSGTSIELGSEAVDSLGAAGISADQIDRHFWQRFGMASLLSIIDAGASNVENSNASSPTSASSYQQGVANSFAQSADQSLQQEGMTPPTLTIHQGAPILVFLAKDLRFDDVMKKSQAKLNIF